MAHFEVASPFLKEKNSYSTYLPLIEGSYTGKCTTKETRWDSFTQDNFFHKEGGFNKKGRCVSDNSIQNKGSLYNTT